MKQLFSALLVVFFATSMMAQTGLTCEDPIPVDKEYEGRVDGPCEVWYTANTYDLPLHVYFIPDADNSTWGPEVQIDFTCTYGVYDDPKLDSLINMVEDFSISFPLELLTESSIMNGKNVWDLEVNKSYREQLADFGLTYPLQALVKVTFYEAGSITLSPDTAFASCMENAHYVALGDTIAIEANDTERTFVFPYTEWQEDSIRFVWTGAEAAEVFVAVQECDFTPIADNLYVWDTFFVAQDAPYKLYSEGMKADIKEHKEGGLYYAKVIAPTAGQLVVEKIPMSAVEGDAQVLEHGTEIILEDILYCFPKNWNATQIIAATSKPLSVYISNVAEFTATANDANVLAVYDAHLEGTNRAVYLSGKELSTLAGQANGDYLYVRFSSVATKVSIDQWSASECADESYLLRPNTMQFIDAKSSTVIYRVRYADFSGYPLTIKWDSSNKLPIYLSDICNYDLTNNNPALLVNPRPNITAGKDYVIDAATVDSWASRIGEDGYFYVRCNPNNPGDLTFVTEKPEEETPEILDPIYTTESATICYGESYDWNGKTYNATGEYTYTTVAVNGADSIVTLNLTVLPEVPVTEEVATICYGETYTWQGKEYTESGDYSVTYQDVNGCDSVVSLALTVYPQTEATTENVEVAYGETYTWHGITYTESGEYTITLQDENGCDYQATLVLTVLQEERPENPCVAASTLLEPVATLTLNLGDAFDIYRIDYQAWLASGVNLVWTGKGALHTFVAKHCEFAVAVYHKEVVNYTEVPAEGNVILSKAILAPLAQYVDADGYLYVRFLTEQEGQLTTAIAE